MSFLHFSDIVVCRAAASRQKGSLDHIFLLAAIIAATERSDEFCSFECRPQNFNFLSLSCCRAE
jgi:hypothetical protein